MPIWGWVCVGLVALVAVGLALIMVWDAKNEALLKREGITVVARVILANPSAYEEKRTGFEFAFVLFTRDADESDEHLAFLAEIQEKLDGFEARGGREDEKKLAWALETQRTIGDVIRIPDRVTGGREVYFTTVPIRRQHLPDGYLTREYICLRVIPEGPKRTASMTAYPDAAPSA
jgi:hypothetical protein